MKLTVQLQPARSPILDIFSAVARLTSLSDDTSVNEGFDHGPYVNLVFETSDIKDLWIRLQGELAQDTALANCSIISCQGAVGWDDFLLLHHFGPAEPLDTLT
jgi:hypothetical protein